MKPCLINGSFDKLRKYAKKVNLCRRTTQLLEMFTSAYTKAEKNYFPVRERMIDTMFFCQATQYSTVCSGTGRFLMTHQKKIPKEIPKKIPT